MDINKLAKSLKSKYSDISFLSEKKDSENTTKFVSTGNLAFDLISDGGVPFGLITEFVGFSQSGKTLFCQKILANAQLQHGAVGIYIDREGALSEKRCAELGIDTSKVILLTPKQTPLITDAYTRIEDLVSVIRGRDKLLPIVIIIDSIAAFDKDVDLEKSDSGRKQKALKDSLRKLVSIIDDNIMVLVVNHYYYNVGQQYGDPRKIASGEGLRYFKSVGFALEDKRKIIDPKRGNEVIGSWLGIEVIKTRLGPCYRTCYVPFYYKWGIDFYGGYLRLLSSRGYLRPKNKKEFSSFSQTTLLYEDHEYNEHNAKILIEKYPNMLFDKYPEYYLEAEEKEIEEVEEKEIVNTNEENDGNRSRTE